MIGSQTVSRLLQDRNGHQNALAGLQTDWRPRRSDVGCCLLLISAYLPAAMLGLTLALPGTSASPFWPPTAVALTALYFGGIRLWPGVLAGALLVNLAFMLQLGLPWPAALPVAALVGAGNALEALVGIALLRTVLGSQFPFESLRGLIAFSLIAAGFAPLLAATSGVLGTRAIGLDDAPFAEHWLTWWLGDASSALVMAPAFMVLWRSGARQVPRARAIELSVLTLLLVSGAALSFGAWGSVAAGNVPLAFLLLPLLLWAVLRFQTFGAALAVLIVAVTAVLGALDGRGPFVGDSRNALLLLLQLFMVVTATATLSLAAALSERNRLGDQLAESNAELRKLAFHDPLTGLPNRRLLRDRLQQLIRQAKRSGGRAAVLYLDLDRFKRINDTLGHEAGDALLQEVASRLQSSVREEDSICRVGGDEFVVLLREVDCAASAAAVAGKIIEALRVPVSLAGVAVTATTSVGIALVPDDSEDADDAIRRADQAMYLAKQQGRNDFRFASDGVDAPSPSRLQRETELRQAVGSDQFRVHYQPIVRMTDAGVVGLQAVPCWHHPKLGMLPRGEFSAIAADCGLLAWFDGWLLEQSCRELSRVVSERPNGLRLALSISSRQLREPRLCNQLDDLLSGAGIDSLWLQLDAGQELPGPELMKRLQSLCASGGVGIALSVGHLASSNGPAVPLLSGLPVELIRLEASLVAELPSDSAARVVSAIIVLAHQLRLDVLAEGVERESQFAFLSESGCDLAIGDYFHPAQAVELLPGYACCDGAC
jgi:diguanylate cyclase (GGDEF)-like protein